MKTPILEWPDLGKQRRRDAARNGWKILFRRRPVRKDNAKKDRRLAGGIRLQAIGHFNRFRTQLLLGILNISSEL